MELLAERRVQGISLHIGPPEGVVRTIGAPVQCAGHDVVSACRVRVIIAATLGNVDLAAGRPDAVGGLDGQKPDGRPEPVALREFGGHFDAAVFDGAAFLGVDATGADGRDDGAVGGVSGRQAVGPKG